MDVQVTGTFPSSNGISDIAYYLMKPKGEARAVLQISHGMCEYFLRYQEFALFLNAHGIAVVGNDHLGHGASAKTKDDLGWFAERDGWKHLVNDLHTTMELGKQAFPEVPFVLMGHSMGSFLARAFLSKYSAELSGSIICGTGGKNPLIGLAIFLSALSTRLLGQRHRGQFIDKFTFRNYCSQFDSVNSAKDWITRDKTIIEKYLEDPHCQFTFTSSAFHDLFCVNRFVNSNSWASSIPNKLPILIISGDMDPVGDFGDGVTWVYHQLRQADQDVQLKLYPEARHEILNEINRQEVYDDILSWFNKDIIKKEESSL